MSHPFKVRSPIKTSLLSLLFCCVSHVLAAQERQTHPPSLVADGPPRWLKDYDFKTDEFTFVRLKYDQPPGRWATDYPDADINFSSRLQQWTSLDVSSKGIVLEANDERLLEYPFAYLSANGIWELNTEQVAMLRTYLDGGGFLMIDDLWGEAEWDNTVKQMAQVLPGRKPIEIPLEHPIFHSAFDLQEKPQVCGIYYAIQGRTAGVTWERADAKDVGYYSINNDQGRLAVLICRNTDLADGWERVGQDAWYAQEFSEKRAFPMGINIVFYVLAASH